MSAVLKIVEKKAACGHNHIGAPSRCKECRNAAYKASVAGNPDTRKNVIENSDGRQCLKCEEMKPWDQFATDKHGYKQKTATCLPCRNEKSRKAYQDNPAVRRTGGMKVRQDIIVRKYGVNFEQVVLMLASQHGLCANRGCSKEISLDVSRHDLKRAVIDHDHKTGKVRELLCGKCNLDLGMIEENEARFLGLMDYKTKHYQN